MNARSEGQPLEEPSQGRRHVAHIRPQHILMNYFAAMTQPLTDDELRSALRKIEGRLEAVHPGVGTAAAPSAAVEKEFEAWAGKGLVKWDGKKKVWKIPAYLRDIYESLSPGVNSELDTNEIDDLHVTIAEVMERHPE